MPAKSQSNMGIAPTEEQIKLIETALASGKSVTAACKEVGLDRVRFYYEIANDKDIATRIARAREVGIDARIDDNQDIADAATAEDWQVARLRIWERQWAASKIKPKMYGDKVQQEVSGPNGAPIVITWQPPSQ